MTLFDVEVFEPTAYKDVAVLRLTGNLDSYSLPDLEKKMQALIRGNRIRLVVNCHGLKFLSSPGMGFFLGALGEVEKLGGSLVFAEVIQPEVRDAMKYLGFFEVFSIYDDEREAIQGSFKKV